MNAWLTKARLNAAAAGDEPPRFAVYQKGAKEGQPVADSQRNIRLALDLLSLRFRYNQFADHALVSHAGKPEGLIDDAFLHRTWLLIDEAFQFRPSLDLFTIVVTDYARRHSFHPVHEYLASLQWDGTPRIDTWLTDYARAVDSPYTKAVGMLFLVAAVRRVLAPGCKFDELLILESPQGTFKSQALRALCPHEDWFSDDLPLGVDAKQIIERTKGKWIIEAAELHGYSNAEVDRLKSMLSRQVDGPVRLAYGRASTEVPRQHVMAGTTNQMTQYLRDSTGNRRMWPVSIQQFDVEALKHDRDQLWAEATVREASGALIRLSEDLWPAAAGEQEARRSIDPWEDLIEDAVDLSQDAVLVASLWSALGNAGTYQKQSDGDRLSKIMQRKGFTRQKKVDVVYLVDGQEQRHGKLPRRSAWVKEGTQPTEVLVEKPQAPY